MSTAEVTRRGFLDMQVCVPWDWTGEQVKAFAEDANPCGTENGWFIREIFNDGSAKEVQCHDRSTHKHVVLEA